MGTTLRWERAEIDFPGFAADTEGHKEKDSDSGDESEFPGGIRVKLNKWLYLPVSHS